MGNRKAPTRLDEEKINLLYRCPAQPRLSSVRAVLSETARARPDDARPASRVVIATSGLPSPSPPPSSLPPRPGLQCGRETQTSGSAGTSTRSSARATLPTAATHTTSSATSGAGPLPHPAPVPPAQPPRRPPFSFSCNRDSCRLMADGSGERSPRRRELFKVPFPTRQTLQPILEGESLAGYQEIHCPSWKLNRPPCDLTSLASPRLAIVALANTNCPPQLDIRAAS